MVDVRIATMALLLAVLGLACNPPQQNSSSTNETVETPDTPYAVAVVNPTEGNDTEGYVKFAQTDEGVRVMGMFNGLEPGMHGFHIHQYGDCTADDGTSAGGHYNPTDNPHAGPKADKRHMGDMGNIEANENGVAEVSYVDPMITLNGPNSIIGHGVILHAGKDDLESQPSGAAGPRVGCGVIGYPNPDTFESAEAGGMMNK